VAKDRPTKIRHKAVVSLLRGYKNRVVLDVGAGFGEILSQLRNANYTIALDISLNALKIARTRVHDCINADAEHLPLVEKAVDILVSVETIEHLPNPQKFLEESFRVIKDEGILVLTTPNAEVPYYKLDREHLHSFTENKLKNLLIQKGFKVVFLKKLRIRYRIFNIIPIHKYEETLIVVAKKRFE